jgi:phosphatidylinositol alpha 1,6-mannosyltransferase
MHVQADINLVPSSATEKYLRALGVRNVHTWTRGVDLEIFDPASRDEDLHDSWGGPLVVGYLGRLAPEKGLKALGILHGLPGIALVVIGDGPERSRLQKLIPDAHFVGRQSGSHLGRHVASLDVLVAPGEHETFCQVIQEGMASGLPVLAPDVGGPRDLVEPGRDGFLYRPGDPEDLIEHVALLGDDPRLRCSMGMAGRAKVRTRTWDNLTQELVEWYAIAAGLWSARSA